MIRLTIPGKPIAQPRHRATSRGGFARLYLPSKHPVRAYKQAIQAAWAASGAAKFHGPVSVVINCHFRAKRKRDVGMWHTARPDADNLGKSVLDALNGLAFADDSQVVHLVCSKTWATDCSTFVELSACHLKTIVFGVTAASGVVVTGDKA